MKEINQELVKYIESESIHYIIETKMWNRTHKNSNKRSLKLT